MDQTLRDRYKNRMELCEKELRRAKHAMIFWSQELGYAAKALSDDKQYNFNDALTLGENKK